MKNRLTIVGLVLLTLISATTFAQSNRLTKSSLFINLPKTITCTAAQLDNFFMTTEGQKINASFDNSVKFNGVISNRAAKYNNKLHSVTINMPDYNNAVFSLSRRMDENNQPVYMGRILQSNALDGYELKKTGKNTYQLVKINLEDILTDCASQ